MITGGHRYLTWKDTPWRWDDKAQGAFKVLNTAMTSEPILNHFDLSKEIMIETDALDYAIGAVY
jgi:hypothetical protein